ncbi:hypothetical protein J3Q64DRAFT_1752054 [Phycomyces blakesleeanus]|uniref:Uncharacterized protein n=2 Tax=Phycomyces blakesleeanus TaxID=4837 RepID=A0A162PH94_PHYB8|nr:hypothetical protein PHYBLDRAFT_78017 [Phycomyces blakesleeanus NRRL 1555(-)]OAD72817.1 hypothetical protein PHYBLDRAFT_78017 [Phycomyces blakesleeanus NRRL 1555(-)]|eukprot:XP_018290857.1 hypothetical protein PHYBLDRAFT_78017 [Phycomyces blakesleeanus NRRL 1555(-)]
MSILKNVFAIHGVFEGLLGFTVFFFPQLFASYVNLAEGQGEFIMRAFGAGILALGTGGILCNGMPDVLPCKRAIGASFLAFHGLLAFLSFQSRKNGSLTDLVGWVACGIHSVMAVLFYVWYKVTESQVKTYTKKNGPKHDH